MNFDIERTTKIQQQRKTAPWHQQSWAEQVEAGESAVERRRPDATISNQPTPKPTLDKPRHIADNDAKVTPQKNQPLWQKSIFQVDIVLREFEQIRTLRGYST